MFFFLSFIPFFSERERELTNGEAKRMPLPCRPGQCKRSNGFLSVAPGRQDGETEGLPRSRSRVASCHGNDRARGRPAQRLIGSPAAAASTSASCRGRDGTHVQPAGSLAATGGGAGARCARHYYCVVCSASASQLVRSGQPSCFTCMYCTATVRCWLAGGR